MTSYLALAASVAAGMVWALPVTAEAASADPVHAEIRVVVADNWVDNASAPTTVAVSVCALLAAGVGVRHAQHGIDNGVAQRDVVRIPSKLLQTAIAETIAEMRVIANMAGLRAVSQPSSH